MGRSQRGKLARLNAEAREQEIIDRCYEASYVPDFGASSALRCQRLIDERAARINAERGLKRDEAGALVAAGGVYDAKEAAAMGRAQVDMTSAGIKRARLRKLKGVTRWVDGMPILSYVRAGYRTIAGQRVKVDPQATGIVQSFERSRADDRAARHAEQHPDVRRQDVPSAKPRSERSKAKQRGRERLAESRGRTYMYEPGKVSFIV